MGNMAAADNKTSPENELSDATCVDRGKCACHADQDALGRQFASHPDPHVRIIAHMSNRQLALSEQMGDTTKMVFKVAGAVHALQEQADKNNTELRTVSKAIEAMTAALEKLTEAVGALTRQQSDLAERTEELEEAAGLGTTVTPT
jgi:methyl-accepting chemotaxis protein